MNDSMRRHGFWPGVRQPACAMVLRVQQRDDVEVALLDDWLVQRLGLDLQAQPTFRHADARAVSVAALVWRVLQLGAFLLQEGRLPVFGVGRITHLAADRQATGYWNIRVLVPGLDFVHPRMIRLAYSKAAKCIEDLSAGSVAPDHVNRLLHELDRRVVQPLRAANRSGVSTVPILREAFRQDVVYRHLGEGIYQLGWGCHARLLDRSVIDTDASIGSKLVNMKHWTARWLRAAGLPTPAHTLVTTEAEAIAAAESMGWPLVVKPADRERSEGVTVSIRDQSTLVQAYRSAARLSKLILVERHVPGICYRLMVADGTVLYAVRRRPVAVLGDGEATVAQLVERAQQANEGLLPWRRAKSISLDALCLQALQAQACTPQDVPAPGVRVALRLIESTEWGGDVEEATSELHPDNAAIAERAARLFRLGNAGVDIITTDIAQPWHQSGAVINEVNFAPHFGGTSAARRLMPVFLGRYVAGTGRIPVEAVVGGAHAMVAGRARQATLCASGVACFVTSHERTLNPDGALLDMSCDGLFERVLALLMNRHVGALVLVVQTEELLNTGLPVDRFASVQLVEGDTPTGGERDGLSGTALARLLQLLRAHVAAEAHHG